MSSGGKEGGGGGGRVLGNDPFKRAAAPTSPTEAPEPRPSPADIEHMAKVVASEPPTKPKPKPIITPMSPKPAQQKRAAPKPPPPPAAPKGVVPKPKTVGSSPARRAVTSFASTPVPKVTAPDRPSLKPVAPPPEAKAASAEPIAQAAEGAPTPPSALPPRAHAGSPSVGPDPIPHAASPTVKHNPRAHEGSPGVGADPVPHPGSPEARHAPQSHEGSPDLKAEFTPHGKSPEMVERQPGGTTPHAGSPAVVAELKSTEAVSHVGSPEVVAGRVTSLEPAPRDVSPGLTRPLWQAASGLMAAAKSALGFGSAGPVDSWGKDEALSRSLHPVGDFLYDRYFRVTVDGAGLIPAGPSIIVANHSGALPLDGPMLRYALRRERPELKEARWLVEDQVFHAPVLGVLVNRIGAVRAHPENAVRLLEEGRPVIVFPEGILGISKPFTQRYQLKRFGRGGYVKLAIKQRVPIVPVAIAGAEESMPLLAKIPAGALGLPYLPLTPPPLPARWRIRFAEPVRVEGSPEDLPHVQEQNDRVRDTIAGMLSAMLAR